ncbi:ubiquitin-conjugating enzyme domain-containing protein [Rhizoctonia solani AG-1 IA]|uniref:Ubiquitin-conjugating enzyme domain-containing protein n=1 Tax=Thanatephorus cucumeris (strain AG1-IA) TaxID=983506 RepID=L8WU72_THACA|nr:ubiquitin-conjugating enzyme domain-containing protein [Rhizoctonia solani AG-1 IA]
MDVGSAIPSRKGSPSVDSRQRHPSPPRLLPIQFVNSNHISPHVPVFLHRPISPTDLGLQTCLDLARPCSEAFPKESRCRLNANLCDDISDAQSLHSTMAPKQSSKKAAKVRSNTGRVKPTTHFAVLFRGHCSQNKRSHTSGGESRFAWHPYSNTKLTHRRSWHDADDQVSPLNPSDPLELPLKKGEFGITDIEHRTRHIVPESEYELVDRTFRVGDVCKRGIDDVASAVVLEVRCELRLKHAISGVPVEGWIPGEEVENKPGVMLGDYVVCNDWVGQVEEIFDEAIILLNDKDLVRVADMGGRFAVGDRGTDILPATGHPPFTSGTSQCILEVQPSVLAVSWLLTPEESANRPRPQQFWTAEDLHHLTYVKIRSENVTRVPDRVTFKDPGAYQRYGVVKTQHRGESGRVLEVETMVVTESRSTAKIMWQDGTIEEVLGTAIIPYLNVDEPGDFVRWKNEDEARVAVVQSTHAQNRTAKVMWYGTSPPQTETVSVLELDPHGPSGTETFGVRRGDFVFLHRPGTTNGAQLPAVPRIGELEEWVREPPPMAQQPHPSHTHTHSHSDENGHFHVYSDGRDQSGNDLNLAEAGWRGVMAALGMKLAEEGASQEYFHTEQLGRERRVVKVHEFKGGSIRWFGEVMNLTTGGLIQVVLPHGEVVEVPLERVTLLNNEGFDELGGWQDGDLSADEGSSYGSEEVMEEVVYPDGQPLQEEEVDGWETEGSEDEDMESAGSWGDDEDKDMTIPGGYIPGSPIPPESATDTTATTGATGATTVTAPVAEKETSPSLPSVPGPSTSLNVSGGSILDTLDESTSPWHRFEILPSAPVDHAYYGHKTTSAQPPKSFMTRLAKEYKVLPADTILVRAYEDRSDLLRCLIIGPQNTPYEDAPFVIDWFLDSSFPQSPPQAHFLSWTNGNGRVDLSRGMHLADMVDRNLYEEGKVCLSILGTWSGDKSSPGVRRGRRCYRRLCLSRGWYWSRSREFDSYRKSDDNNIGLDGSASPHMISSEGRKKAYVLSRGFIRRALEVEVGGLETEIEWYYIKQGRLARAIEDARALVARSEAGEYEALKEVLKESDPAVGVLSEGAVIMLRRTLDKLDAILKERTKSS